MRELVLDSIHFVWVPFLIMATVLPPMLWPLWRARQPLRLAQAKRYLIHLWAALVVGGVSSGMLWPSLFGNALAHGSTASLIFIAAPICGLLALFAAYAVAMLMDLVFFKHRTLVVIPLWAKRLYALPVGLLCIMVVGLFMSSAELLVEGLPANATHPETLRWLASRSDVLAPGQKRAAYKIAGNPNAPADVLETLSQHAQARVRLGVATNAHTETAVLTRLSQDCAPEVRQAAQQRLGLPLSEAGASAAETRPCTPPPDNRP